ncbi:hypothetical protein, partial [Pseudomonas sp. FEN]
GSCRFRRVDDDRPGQHPDYFHGFYRLGPGEKVQGRSLRHLYPVLRAGPRHLRVRGQERGDRADRVGIAL